LLAKRTSSSYQSYGQIKFPIFKEQALSFRMEQIGDLKYR
jgi:hypothetical protein